MGNDSRTMWRHRVSTWLEYINKRFNDDTNRGNHIPVKHIKGGVLKHEYKRKRPYATRKIPKVQ